MNDRKKVKPGPIDPDSFGLKLSMHVPLHTMEPSEYASAWRGRIVVNDEDGNSLIAGRVALTLYDLERAEIDGQHPLEVFDCLSESALELYQDIYDGYDLKEGVEEVVEDVTSPSLLVIEIVEVLPQYRGGGLGLAAALKAMHLLGPAGGMVALLAAPLNQPFWHRRMKMEEFPPASPQVREKLGKYWERLGFRQLGSDSLYLRNLENLPTISDLLSKQR
jgi:hypothetical protein